jgi:Fe-S-cluster containining protein
MTGLHQIQDAVHLRTQEIASAHTAWPCRRGCDDCCRSLASAPRVTQGEWRLIAAALDTLPAATAESTRRRIEASASASRPVVCPFLDTDAGACLIYDARPVACRAYGFYAERESVLGCHRIASIAAECSGVVWGNHAALEERLGTLGPAATLAEWLTRTYTY